MMIVNADGSVSINSGLAENGQGLRTVYAQIAAEALGVNYEDISFYGTDTHSIPDCGMEALTGIKDAAPKNGKEESYDGNNHERKLSLDRGGASERLGASC